MNSICVIICRQVIQGQAIQTIRVEWRQLPNGDIHVVHVSLIVVFMTPICTVDVKFLLYFSFIDYY